MDTKEKKTGSGTKRTARRSDSRTAGAAKSSGAVRRKRESQAAPQETRKRRTSAASRKVSGTARTKLAAAPDVVYTPAKPFSRDRFLLRLATVVAVVIALMFGVSIFFRVEHVTVSGVDKYTPYMIQQAAGIKEGDALLGLSDARISGKITSALPYVENVSISI